MDVLIDALLCLPILFGILCFIICIIIIYKVFKFIIDAITKKPRINIFITFILSTVSLLVAAGAFWSGLLFIGAL